MKRRYPKKPAVNAPHFIIVKRHGVEKTEECESAAEAYRTVMKYRKEAGVEAEVVPYG